ncbi:MAG: beta-N-acetylhexosaminidase [Nitrospirota bacterium]
MNLKEMAGQLLMLGFNGDTPSKGIIRLIKKGYLGGVILFKRNLCDPFQIASLCNSLQRLTGDIPLFVSIDHEGGRINRLSLPFTQLPANSILGRYHSIEEVYKIGRLMARELKAVGINMNFAPVLDINTNPSNPVIGDRAFGDNPDIVSTLGLALISGLQDNGMIACGKHFPGHGDTDADSHSELPRLTHNIKRLIQTEMVPFQYAVRNNLHTIMTAHIIYDKLDERYPATLSKKIITDILRRDMGFNGVVITDDLSMKAISENFSREETIVKCIDAGCDIILISQDREEETEAIPDILFDLIDKREIPEYRIRESYIRVQQLKENFLLPYRPIDTRMIMDVIGKDKTVLQG